MIRRNKIDIEHAKKAIEDLGAFFSRFGDKVVVAYLFGSLAMGTYTPLSDIDIAVLLAKGLSREIMEELENEILEGLMKIFKTDEIDLVVLNSAPLSVRYGVLKTAKIIYCSNTEKTVDFQTEVVSKYLDIKPYREEFYKEFVKSL
ncbi:type VII toxin-antitoxin system MntA family adenylyltransferase antitoxin [Caldicellulosiruptor acetigenus]|uniref:type VII toxin-antitoxin system MntA family adenylyltransferase antitoxin n=1 Tax=Caldicellulosiruptor acetigenus TaxID=301953 RepID=UPI000492B8F3|nr:nucleotidyltransferase domain-containing protein [Caldicellulosiruptor acetigenus]WAM36753.1 nucleotidyltransferase domain-containing protein [Caldicellulosiruptor acetigenus]